MTTWVSFSELKQQVSIEDILRHYGLIDGLRRKEDELIGLCPFHQESKGSFHASIAKNAFQCFGCKRKGNVLDFVSLKEEVDIRQAALLIQEWFQISSQRPPEAPEKPEKPRVDIEVPPEPENQPLNFELKNLDPKHPYLEERGLKKETVEHFGLGFCSRGVMKDRIAIPIRDGSGDLVAYAGRCPGDPQDGEEKYMLPQGFAKSKVVFNLHQAGEAATETGLILVEGFFDTFRISQAGFPQVAALMGSWLSEKQKELLVSCLGPQGRLTLLFDADDAGRECEARCLQELSGHVFVKAVMLPYEGDQPDKLSDNVIHALLGR